MSQKKRREFSAPLRVLRASAFNKRTPSEKGKEI